MLAQDTPAALVAAAGTDSLEHAFIHHLEQAGGDEFAPPAQAPPARAATAQPIARWFSWRRYWAFAWRESLEVARDPIRLAFAWGSMLFLMVVMGLGISFDVENLRYGVLDHDQTSASRVYLENFAGSRYFRQVAAFGSDREAEDALLAGTAPLVVEIPPGFGDDLQRGRRPEVAFWIEGGMPFRAENIRAYAKGIHERYVKDLRRYAPIEREGLSDSIYLWPAQGASNTPMYAGFAIGQGWDSGVLLDSDPAGNEAKKKIESLYLKDLAQEQQQKFRVFLIGAAAKIKKTDAAIEELFTDEYYLEMVNTAYGLKLDMAEMPKVGSDMITKRIGSVMKKKCGYDFDKGRVVAEMLRRFDGWREEKDLPPGTADMAEQLVKTINTAFGVSGKSAPSPFSPPAPCRWARV